ncbi:MAG: NTP transferase domain-containing protein [Gemmatimonadetes bacterium]|nr:NTP transferase domain-containing protein [Gemmatimonadota bacterium]
MRVVVPVAGIGTRLRPLTDHVPKILLPVAGQPILGHILDSLIPVRPVEIVLVVGYRGDQVRDYVAEAFSGLPVRFVEQREQRGLGHAVLQALDPVRDEESLLVLLGDTIFDVDYAALAARDADLLGVRRVEDPRRFGIAVVDAGRITRLVEKPEQPVGDLALVGIYRFRRAGPLRSALLALLDRGITTRGEVQLTDGLQLMLEEGVGFEPFEVEGWFDCGTPDILLETNRVLLERAAGRARGAVADGPPGARIVQPVHIGARVDLTAATLGPHVAIGDGSRILRSTLRDAIVGRGAEIRDAHVEHAVVGDGARVNGGTVTGLVAPASPQQPQEST